MSTALAASTLTGQRVRVSGGTGRMLGDVTIGRLIEVTTRHLVLDQVAHNDAPTVAIALDAVSSVVTAGPQYRARVFFYPYEYGSLTRRWTWCTEVDEEIYDHVWNLPVCESWQDAYDKATTWLRSKYKATA